ncbi:MAG: hypothetical protein RIR69_401, partial [Actinomycetota bacterium]
GITQRTEDGKVRFAYGGQFGDEPNDGNFVADGLLHADMTPHPAMREVAWVHRPIRVTLLNKNGQKKLKVENRQWFSALDNVRAVWTMIVDGVVAKTGELKVPVIAPDSAALLSLPVRPPQSATEVFFNIEWRLNKPTSWASKNHVVAWDQVVLRVASPARQRSTGSGAPPVAVTPRVTLWRAATDNDGFKMMPHLWANFGRSLERWLAMGIATDGADVVSSTTTVTELVNGASRYDHVVQVPEHLSDIPRIGATFEIPARFSQLRWYGRGPHENYPDRKLSAMVGVYEQSPDDLPYLMPQEFGLRTDCRWLECCDPKTGEVVRIEADRCHLHMSATRYRAHDLFAARDRTELTRHKNLVIHLDIAHRGLGTASCGPDTLEKYHISPGTYRFAYVVSGSTR